MTTINTIEDLARILKEHPTWAETLRALLLTQELLDLPARFDRFIQAQEETNRLTAELLAQLKEAQAETNQRVTNLEGQFTRMEGQFTKMEGRFARVEGRFTRMEGRFGNFEGAQYERIVRTKALARCHINLGFDAAYVALNQDGLTDPRLASAMAHAVRERLVTREDSGGLYEADLIISAEDNRHAVFEISLTADAGDIQRARQRADILETVTGGAVIPAVITAQMDSAQYGQAEAEGVAVFVIPYP